MRLKHTVSVAEIIERAREMVNDSDSGQLEGGAITLAATLAGCTYDEMHAAIYPAPDATEHETGADS